MIDGSRYIDNMDVDGPMPPAVKEVFAALRCELAWLHAKWAIYSQLYCRGDARLGFLDAIAPGFFVVVRDSIQNELMVGLCRLTDPLEAGGNRNLTLSRLAAMLEAVDADTSLREEFDSCLAALDRACSPLRDWRNRRLGHSDLPTALGSSAKPLLPVTWSAIDGALAQARTLMNLVERHYLESEFYYEHFTDLSDGDDLVFYLEEAQRFEDEERRRALGE